MRLLGLVACLAFAAPAAAQRSTEALLDRLRSVDGAAGTPANCDVQVERSETLNGADLLYAASVCFAANRPVEGSFLLNAGQIRATADLALMVPATRADSDAQLALYGVIFFHAGGAGAEEVLRDPALRERFLRLFDEWSPAYWPDYSPGWNNRRRPDASAYRAAIEEAKGHRREQLAEIARLFADETYFSLHRRHQDLQARNPNGFMEGTADADLSRELTRQMGDRARALGSALYSVDGEPADASTLRFPPDVPAADEIVLAENLADPVAERCAALAERMTIARDGRVARLLITRSGEWGTIWRADLTGEDRSPERFTCTERSTSSRPLAGPDGRIPRLPRAQARRRERE